MTCVIAIIEDNKLYMGSDTRLSDDDSKYIDTNYPKIIEKSLGRNKIYIGYCGDGKVHNILDSLEMPKMNKMKFENYMKNIFLPLFKDKINESKYLKDEELDLELLIFYKGDLYEISSNLSFTKINEKFYAIGSGGISAISCLNLILPYKEKLLINNVDIIKQSIKSISKILTNVSEKSIVVEYKWK